MILITENELTNNLLLQHATVIDINLNALIASTIATYRFKDQGVWVILLSDTETIEARVKSEVDAREWIQNNPISALRQIVDTARRRSDDLGELDVAILTLAAAYEAWADGLPLPLDVEGRPHVEQAQRIAGGRAKARRLRDLAKALEVSQ